MTKIQTVKHILACMLVVACFGFSLMPTLAEARGVIRVTFTQYVPWKTVLPDGSLSGIDIELLALMAERMDLDLEVTEYPWKRGLEMLKSGEIDVLSSFLRRPDREVYAHFIEPPYVRKSHKAFFVVKGKEDTITEYEDLTGLRVGVFPRNHYFERFDQDVSIKKTPAQTTEQIFEMLLADRLDAVIMTEEVGEFKLKEFGFDGQIVKARYKYTKPMDVFLALSKRSPLADRRKEMSLILEDLLREGVVDRLREKYLGASQ